MKVLNVSICFEIDYLKLNNDMALDFSNGGQKNYCK